MDLNSEKKDAKKVDRGDYVFSFDEERKVAASVLNKISGTTLVKLSLEGVSPGSVSITYLDNDWICGALKLKSQTSEFNGPYAARFVK